MEYLIRENKELKLPFLVEKFGRWWGGNPATKKEEEIDIVGIDKNNGLYVECKYRNEKVGMKTYVKLVERSELVPREKRYYYLFSKVGFSNELIKISEEKENINLVTLVELYENI